MELYFWGGGLCSNDSSSWLGMLAMKYLLHSMYSFLRKGEVKTVCREVSGGCYKLLVLQ